MESNLDRLVSTFNKMENDGFNTEDFLKWGFFFINHNENNLLSLFNELADNEYKFEYLRQVENEMWMLYVTKIDILSAKKLHKRNVAFNKLAEYSNVSLYDGWDVEKIYS